MGNVHASSQAPDQGFPAGFAPGMPPPPPVNEDVLENPGKMDDLHKKCKDVFPVNFEGAKIAVQKGLSNHFQISHSLNMSSLTPSGYRFGATYVGTQQYGPGEVFPVLVGDIDPSGNLNANMYHRLTNAITATLQAQVQNSKLAAMQCGMDYKGNNFTSAISICNPDILSGSGVIVGHYLQSVTKSVDLGAEIAYQRTPQLPGSQVAVTSLAARYTGDDYTVSGTMGFAGLHLCYYQKASSQLQLGVELETNFRVQEAVASIGYQIDIPKADLIFKGMLDSNWNVGATLEKKLMPMPFSLTLSGIMNHQKNQFRLGLGFIIG